MGATTGTAAAAAIEAGRGRSDRDHANDPTAEHRDAVLERIALHQTRLHTPGLGLDAKGVALGAKGLVLLPSVERLVALLAAATRERSLEDMVPSLAIHVARSALGTREVVVELAAESSERMDRLADLSRPFGGFAFTGTSRHFVQYRDASAPFGYDAPELLATDAAFALYHRQFSQAYDVERTVPLRALLLRLMPRPDGSTRLDAGPRVVVAEHGLGPALVQYLVRSRVCGEVGVVEWPPESALDDAPVRRWLLRVPDLPARMRPLLHATPGVTCFVPAGAGAAVEAGFRHPVELRACPVFDAAGLVLFRGGARDPWVIDRPPVLAALDAFARVELRSADRVPAPAARAAAPEPAAVAVPLRVLPSNAPWRDVTAAWVPPGQIPLLRRLAYLLPHATVAQTRVAVTSHGAFLQTDAGVEAVPIGTFFVRVHPRVYVPAGHDVAPAVAPEALARAVAAPPSHVLFVGADARAVAIDESAFVPLESALLEAPPWDDAVAEAIATALEAPIDLKATAVGLLPLRGVEPAPKGG